MSRPPVSAGCGDVSRCRVLWAASLHVMGLFYFLLLFYFITLFPFIEILEKKGGESHVSSTTPVLATHLHLLSQNAPLAAVLGSYHSAWQLKSEEGGSENP